MADLFAVQYAYLIPLLPLFGAALSGFLGARWLKQHSHWPIWIGVGASALLSIVLLVQVWNRLEPYQIPQTVRTEGGQGIDPRNTEAIVAAGLKNGVKVSWYTWFRAGSFVADASVWIDPLTAVMLCVVTGIGLLICIFSKGYMAGEGGYFRFFAYLGLFIFMMTVLVMGDNFLLLYLGWEGVGLCSYLLIGHYYERPAAREAAKKAFLVNRIGDFGFALGIMLIFLVFGTVSYFETDTGGPGALLQALTRPATSQWEAIARQWIPFLLMLGAFGKSAQFPLYVWLPDAMEGPTPVSALIHAATMVTAGVYMIVRCGTLFVGIPAAMWTIAIIGAFTAIFAATIALRQFDLKKVFAYSTISQLGFMFVAAGVLAPVAAIFHLVTHAFFKALLFLSSGVVMHAMLGHLDMRRMSGLRRALPWTNLFMLAGCAALAGFPFLSGFFSKDEIVAWTWHQSKLLGLVLLATAFLTAYYTFRLYFRVFQGPEVIPAEPAEGHHAPDHTAAEEHAHASAAAVQAGDVGESGVDTQLAQDRAHHGHHIREPWIMMLPLAILAIGAVLAGYINWPHWEGRHLSLGEFLHNSPSLLFSYDLANAVHGHVSPAAFGMEELADPRIRAAMHSLHVSMMLISAIIAGLGIYMAYLFHLKYRERGEELAARFPGVTRLLEAKYWVDEVYQAGIVEPLRSLGRIFFAIDRYIIDGIIWIVSFIPQLFGFSLKLTTQRGSLQGYAVMMLLGIALVLLVLFM